MPRPALRDLPALAAFLFPIFAVFEKNFTSVFLVVLLGAAAVLARPFAVRLWTPLVAALGALMLLCLVSALWSLDPGHSATRFIRLGLAVAAGTLLCGLAAARDFDGRKATMTALAVGMVVAGLIAIASRYGAALLPEGPVATFLFWMPLTTYGAIAALLVFVLAASLAEGRVPAIVPVALAVAALAILLTGNNSSKVALAAGCIATGAFFWLGRRAVLAAAVVLPALIVALPVVLHVADTSGFLRAHGWTLNHSATHRLIIGRYAMEMVEERPVLGYGLHSARILPGRDAQVWGNPDYEDLLGLTDFAPGTKIELMPMHPHNATLQTWLELGVLGPILYAILFGLVLAGVNRVAASPWARAAGGGAVVAALVIGQISFNVWQSWWLLMEFLAAALFLYAVPKRRTDGAPG